MAYERAVRMTLSQSSRRSPKAFIFSSSNTLALGAPGPDDLVRRQISSSVWITKPKARWMEAISVGRVAVFNIESFWGDVWGKLDAGRDNEDNKDCANIRLVAD